MGDGLLRSLRVTGFRVLLGLAVALALRLMGLAGFFRRLLVARFARAGLALRRVISRLFRVAPTRVRPAGFAAVAERGFFVFIQGSDPFQRASGSFWRLRDYGRNLGGAT